MTNPNDHSASERPDNRDESLEAQAKREVAEWPPLSPEQKAALSGLLGKSRQSAVAGVPLTTDGDQTDTTEVTDERIVQLREWARGDLALEAAIELLIGAVGGHLLDGPWVRRDGQNHWYFYTKCIDSDSGYLSGGERRVLAIAASLAVSNRPVDLGDAITGLDPGELRLVLQALEHAGGTGALGGLGGNTDEPR